MNLPIRHFAIFLLLLIRIHGFAQTGSVKLIVSINKEIPIDSNQLVVSGYLENSKGETIGQTIRENWVLKHGICL